jgi:hypothetical protein
LAHLLDFNRKSDGATKKKILGCIFAEKLIFELRAQSAELSVRLEKKNQMARSLIASQCFL